jgi:hypothetical protein
MLEMSARFNGAGAMYQLIKTTTTDITQPPRLHFSMFSVCSLVNL